MYLTNIERQQLDLLQYGSFVPDEVVAEARQRLEEATAGGEAVLQEIQRKRARKPSGRFKPDDPETAEVNEAWEGQ